MKHSKRLTASLMLVVVALWAALPATDAFTDTNGVALSTHNANWAYNVGTFAIHTNAVLGSTGEVRNVARWTGDSFNANQYSQAKLVDAVSAYPGVAVRIAGGTTATYYYFMVGPSGAFLGKIIAGANTNLAAPSRPTNGDTIRIEANGTSISALVNGVVVAGPITDTDIASGAAGIAMLYGDANDSWLDDWEGGNLAGATRRRVVLIQ